MQTLDQALDDFVGETLPNATARKPRKLRTKHVGAFSTDQPVPGEEPPPPPPPDVPQVYAAISAVTADIMHVGIGKTHRNTQQGYAFRGIDDVLNLLPPFLTRHGLVILPQVEERTVTERVTKQGTALIYVTVRMAFDLISTRDGSRERVTSYGEAMDSGDKATNKALSTAYKYFAMQTFCIPTIGIDPEQDTYEVAASGGDDQPQVSESRSGPTPGHIETLMSVLHAKTSGPRAQAELWWRELSPEDKNTIRTELDKSKQGVAH